jgi:hypothetical protein
MAGNNRLGTPMEKLEGIVIHQFVPADVTIKFDPTPMECDSPLPIFPSVTTEPFLYLFPCQLTN